MRIVLNITRHNVTRCLAVLLLALALILELSVPYYQYGSESSVFEPEGGLTDMLIRPWVLRDVGEGDEGYVRIDVTEAKKMTVTRTVNGETVTEKGKVNYKEKNGVLKLTFADGTVKETVFLPQLAYDAIGYASLAGYPAFVKDHEELTETLTRQLEQSGDAFSFRDVAIPTVLLPIFGILAIVLTIIFYKRSFALAFSLLPALYGIYLMYFQKIAVHGMPQAKTQLLAYLLLPVLLAAYDYLCEKGIIRARKRDTDSML